MATTLMPPEVIAARRGHKVRSRVIAGLLLFVLVLSSWYAFAWTGKKDAQTEFDAVSNEARVVQEQQGRHADVVNVQSETGAIAKQLSTLLAKDLQWAMLLGTLRDTGVDSGVTVTGVSGSLNATGTTATTAGKLPTTGGPTTVGTLTVTGNAPGKPALAKYVEALAKLDVVANPYLTSATESTDEVEFSLQVDISADALGGRFTPKSSTGGN